MFAGSQWRDGRRYGKTVTMAMLVAVKGPEPGRQYPLEEGSTDMGRHVGSAICLESQAVSRHHAIVRQKDKFYIEDLGSSNGTYLNGQHCVAHPSDRARHGAAWAIRLYAALRAGAGAPRKVPW